MPVVFGCPRAPNGVSSSLRSRCPIQFNSLPWPAATEMRMQAGPAPRFFAPALSATPACAPWRPAQVAQGLAVAQRGQEAYGRHARRRVGAGALPFAQSPQVRPLPRWRQRPGAARSRAAKAGSQRLAWEAAPDLSGRVLSVAMDLWGVYRATASCGLSVSSALSWSVFSSHVFQPSAWLLSTAALIFSKCSTPSRVIST